jgi:protein tyrosine/serine phosphatase
MNVWGFLLSRLYNWHWVDRDLARSAQVYGRHVPRLLEHHGIRAVINLRGDNRTSGWYRNEREACEARGAAYLDVRLSSKRPPDRDTVLALLDALDAAPKPALIKCSGGAERTGFAAALHLLHKGGADALPEARRQMAFIPYFHWPKPHQRWIRVFFDYYAADQTGQPFRDWVATRYSPEAFKAFLTQRGQGDFWR